METNQKEVDPKELLKEPLLETKVNQTQEFLCEIDDKECMNRMIQSLSDCV